MDIEQRFHKLLLVLLLLCIPDGLCIVPDEDYIDEPSFNRCPWIRNKLKNGRVRYRYKGRVAKFLCDSGFELAGKRSSTCVRGQWSNPVPVCVARGCGRLPSLLNGRVTEMYRGAFLVYDCNPGYVLDGNPTNHCNGRTWYTSTPLCVVATENPETYCDFENPDLCGWSHDPNHDFDWQRNQFSTPSGHVGTGPAFDHTFGENKGGFYLFIEASSPRKINDTARLFSPVYPKELSGGCFTFWYHMYGATTGRLRIYLKPESHVFDELKPNWEKIGDQGNQWLKGHIIVPVLHENFQIVIEGVRGESYVGDSAIDDVRLTANLCDTDDNSTDITEAVDQHSCRGRCQESGSESSCGCNPNCVDEANYCCRDYYTICTAGNSTATPNSEEPLAEDYMTTSSVSPLSSTYTPVKSSAEDSNITTELTTEKLEPTSDTFSVLPSTISSTYISQVSNTSTTVSTVIPISYSTLNISSTKYSTDTQPATIPDKMLSTSIKPEASTSSTTVLGTTESFLRNNSLVTENSAHKLSTVLILNASTSSTTSTKVLTTISTTTPTTSTTTITTPFSTTTTTTAFSTTTQTSPKTTKIISSIFPTTLKSTTKTDPMTVFTNNFTTVTKNISSYRTDFHTTSSAAAMTLKSEPTNLSTSSLSSTTASSTTVPSTTESTATVPLITELSTRKIYNLRPRTRIFPITTTSSVSSTSQTSPKSTTSLKDATSTISSTTRSGYLTSWYRYTVSPKTQQFTSTSVIRGKTSIPDTSTTSYARWETTVENIPETTRFFDRIRKPTESNLPKSSELYGSDSSKAKTTSNNSRVPVVVSIIIITLICIIAGLVYYLRRKRSKRQSKLSDDSEMRFLEENDYMEYSDASVLDKILEK